MKFWTALKTLFGFAQANPERTRSALLALVNKIAAVAKALKALADAAKDEKTTADEIHARADEILAATEQAKAELAAPDSTP